MSEVNSRLIVKNLPKHLTDERFKAHFSRRGDFVVTDCKIVKAKNNEKVSRRFGFVGFQTVEQAQKALKYFNNTFLDTSKLQVEFAVPYGDPNMPRAWSKYTPGSSAHKEREARDLKKKGKDAKGKDKKDADSETPKKGTKKGAQNDIEDIFEGKGTKRAREDDGGADEPEAKQAKLAEGDDAKKSKVKANKEEMKNEKFAEYMNLMTKTGKQLWTNDDQGAEEKLQKKGKKKEIEEVSEDEESSEEYEDLPVNKKNQTKNLKVNKESDDEEDDDSDEEGGEDAAMEVDEEAAAFARDDKVSDLDYLKSKVSKNIKSKLDESDDDEEEGDDDDEEVAESEDGEEEGDEDDDSDDSSSDDDSDEDEDDVRRSKALFVPDIADSGRLFVRNLPYQITEVDIRTLFQKFGELAEVHVARDKETGKPKGIAFVRFAIPSDAIKAHEKLDATIFQGRLLHVLPSKLSKEELKANAKETSDAKGFKSDYQKEKEAKKKAAATTETHAWNPLYIRQDAVMSAMAERYDVDKAQLMDPENQNLGLRQALGETSIVNETKRYLTENGVSLEALEGLYSKGKLNRSDSIIFVKNIPAATEAIELKALFGKFGKLGRIILPPTKTMAMIEFVSPSDAKAAFKSLAYREFHEAPLFLEWAPMDVWLPEFKEIPTKLDDTSKTKAGVTLADDLHNEELEQAENAHSNETTVYVKNLHFDTTEASLEKMFKKVGELRNVTIAKKRDMKNEGKLLSMGYGFVEFKTREAALEAFKTLQSKVLDGHSLELQLGKASAKATSSDRKETKRKAASTKLMVKNVPFQANKKEIRELFASFGELKSVRLPLKQGGKGHRGFAFVEFLTKEEASNAMEALANTHLYGRHLVIDFGEEEKGLGAKDGKGDEKDD